MTSNLRGFWNDKEAPNSNKVKPKVKEIKKTKRKKKKQSRKERAKELYATKGNDFYKSPEWLRLRYRVIQKYGGECMACGRSKKHDGVTIHVDHIRPRSKYPHLSLVFDNLQILCSDCNLGKLHLDQTDWRPDECEAELEILNEAIKRM